jgi:hypothetical protein
LKGIMALKFLVNRQQIVMIPSIASSKSQTNTSVGSMTK